MTVTLQTSSGLASAVCCPASRVTADGRFDTQGHEPGSYFVTVSGIPAGWSLASETQGGADVVHTPLVLETRPVTDVLITFTDRSSEIGGLVAEQNGARAVSASVVLFPADFQTEQKDGVNPRLVRLARPSPQNGAYRFMNVTPGDYLIAAADDDALAQWPDPAVMATLAGGASKITVAVDEHKDVNLTARRP
jgi:hypothetical protein